ncbi:Cof-type HAD-IIB family hydrolase [Paenibacillus thalictri]|uniref:HAD family hydrolase n=1 Tax=Paenibacillus thalictri TaxID=2527873 RepID=A0A4Q9DPC7_9BACL|nr:Cof-type HAD-IIB family hydrolase [Paenibacillus thalictri]TBL75640.1 HAD family hydrolase [Paenibacillus thalictri]
MNKYDGLLSPDRPKEIWNRQVEPVNNILIISDLDGTLLNKSHQISPENEDAIRRFTDMGGLFTLATGRIEQSVEPFVRQLGIDLPLILYNGAKIVHPASGKVLFEKYVHIPRKLWDDMLALVSDNIALLFYKDGKVFTTRRCEILERHERKDGVNCILIDKDEVPSEVTKILLIGSPPSLLKAYEELLVKHALPCETVYSESNYLEILPEGVSKGTTLEELTRMLQRETLYTIAVGDNLNDLTMIQSADRGYAVENAHPQLKEAADAITVHHEDHAIASIIEHILEQRKELA